MQHPSLATAFTALLAALPAAEAGMYSQSSPVLQVDARSYERLIAKSNHSSIIEFYAPWCGHCQNLKPAYEKAALKLKGLAKVAAIDCDQDTNKQFCSSMGVQGFPTLKIVRPGKKPGSKPVVEDYQGPRTAKSIVDTLVSKINNHVARIEDKDLDAFLAGDRPKALLFTEKGTTSALTRSIAIDFLDVISVGQVRSKSKAAVERFGIEKFPTLVLIPGEGKNPIIYTGELVKKDLVEFISQAGQPNPDPAPSSGKGQGKGEKKKKTEQPASRKAEETSGQQATAEPKASPEDPRDTSTSTTSTGSAAQTPDVMSIATITNGDMLVDNCLQPKSHTCVLAFIPAVISDDGEQAVASLSQLKATYHLFPFFSVPSDVEGSSSLKEALKLTGDVEVIALNARRGWWRHYDGSFSVESVRNWIDMIRMGEGKKNDLPKGVIAEGAKTATEGSTDETHGTDPVPEAETWVPEREEKVVHEEL